jgi:hypothetical protein
VAGVVGLRRSISPVPKPKKTTCVTVIDWLRTVKLSCSGVKLAGEPAKLFYCGQIEAIDGC